MMRWKDISVSRKLFLLVGTMALLIAIELFTLMFAMDTLSAVRSFVGGEGLWSKAQKTAVRSLQKYAYTHQEKDYQDYLNALTVPLGDRKARNELMKPNPDMQVVREGFLQGRIHPDDIPGLVDLVQRFHNVSYVRDALIQWGEGDRLIGEFMIAGEELRAQLKKNPNDRVAIATKLENIYAIDDHLTAVEDQFSFVLGEGSRWLENIIFVLLFSAVLLVEGIGLTLTFLFSRNLGRSLRELNRVASEVGEGNFDVKAAIRSKDEIGMLANSINQMTSQLKSRLRSQEKAENANQLKTLFLANMSHEIRTPVGIIIGLTEVMSDPKTQAKEHDRLLATIRRTGNNLLRVINDILDISRVESGHIEIENHRFQLKEFMQNAVALMQVRARETHNELKLIADEPLPEEIISDPSRLNQILVNLINNALKFTEHGKVEIRYGVEGDLLSISIKDNGIGIDSEGIAKLFHIFSQVDSTSIRKRGGSGLGLILSKRLANLLGGDVTLVRTGLNAGAEFLVQVKLQQIEAPAQLVKTKGSMRWMDADLLKNHTVLVVEDNKDNQFLITHYLNKVGMKIEMANDGREGVEKALKIRPEFILMDMQMPIKDGLTATSELRAQGYDGVIIALTANAMKEYRDQCLSVGCDDYLTKPIEMLELYSTLSRFVEDHRLAK